MTEGPPANVRKGAQNTARGGGDSGFRRRRASHAIHRQRKHLLPADALGVTAPSQTRSLSDLQTIRSSRRWQFCGIARLEVSGSAKG